LPDLKGVPNLRGVDLAGDCFVELIDRNSGDSLVDLAGDGGSAGYDCDDDGVIFGDLEEIGG
jgi:hypothetical protein